MVPISFFTTGNVFRNAEFRCRVRRHDHQLVHHRVSIRLVQNELDSYYGAEPSEQATSNLRATA